MRRKLSAMLLGIAMFSIAFASGQQPVTAEPSKDARATAQPYLIYVRTGNVSGAGTDANVYVQLFGTSGNSPVLELESNQNDFERNDLGGYSFTLNDLGTVNRVCLWRNEAGLGDEWNVAYVTVAPRSTPGQWTAPFNGWMPAYKWICRRAT